MNTRRQQWITAAKLFSSAAAVILALWWLDRLVAG